MKLSEFIKGGKFQGFRKMIGGEVFYFGRDYGVTDQSAACQLRATVAAESIAEAFKAAGGNWTAEGIANAKAAALAAANPAATPAPAPAPAPKPAAAPVVVATPAAPAPAVASSGLSVHAAIDRLLAELLERVETKDVTYNYYDGLRVRFVAIKKAWPDMPLDAVDRNALTAAVGYWKKRPKTYKGEPCAVNTVIGRIGAIGFLFRWAYNAEIWQAPKGPWENLFKFDADNLRSPKEKKQSRGAKEAYTVDELATLYRFARPRTRLYMLLALQCGMGQMEIATLREWDYDLTKRPAFIDRERNKTGVQARYELWKETAEALDLYATNGSGAATVATILEKTNFGYSRDYHKNLTYKRTPAYAPNVGGDITDITTLALRTEDGYPLVHRSGKKGAKTDAISLAWRYLYRTLKKEAAAAKAEGRAFAMPRMLGFYALRRTGAQFVQDIAGREVAKIYLAHATVEDSGRKSVMEKHYTDRSATDFDKVATALQAMRATLAPMFAGKAPAKPQAAKGKGKAA